MSKDSKTISNEYHELVSVAVKLKIPAFVVYLAKFKTKSNNREVVEKWIVDNEEFIKHLIES